MGELPNRGAAGALSGHVTDTPIQTPLTARLGYHSRRKILPYKDERGGQRTRQKFLFSKFFFEEKGGDLPRGTLKYTCNDARCAHAAPSSSPLCLNPSQSRTPALAARQLAGARERDASQATTATAPRCASSPSLTPSPKLRLSAPEKEGAPRSTPLREGPHHCESVRRIWTPSRGDRRRGKRLPPLLPGGSLAPLLMLM